METCIKSTGLMRLVSLKALTVIFCIGIACWLQRWTHDGKVVSSNPGRRGRRMFFSSQLCVLTLIWCPFHPCVTTVAHKRPGSFCQKCRWQVIPKHAYPWPIEVGVGWLCHCPDRVLESIRKWAHTQLIGEHSVTVVSSLSHCGPILA